MPYEDYRNTRTELMLALFCAGNGVIILWGFDMSDVLTGWSALRLALGVFSWLYAAYRLIDHLT